MTTQERPPTEEVTGICSITVSPGISDPVNGDERVVVNGHPYNVRQNWSIQNEELGTLLVGVYEGSRQHLLTTPDTTLVMTGTSYRTGQVIVEIKTERPI